MPRRLGRRAWMGAALLAVLGALAWGVLTRLTPPRSSQIERLWQHPERLQAMSPATAAAPGPPRWDTAAIAREWQPVAGGSGALLRSPALELADGVDSIVVELSPAPGAAARLLWSAGQTPTDGDRARNVQELAGEAARRETIAGARLLPAPFSAASAAPPRHLFLEGADRAAILALVRSVEVVRVQDRLRDGGGSLPVNLGGEIRDALHTSVPGTLAYRTALPQGAELRVGLAARGVAAGATVTVELAGRRTRVLLTRPLEAGERWTDLRVPLPGRGPVTLRLQAGGSAGGGTVLWGSPMIVPTLRGDARPNVILYLMDALRADHLGYQGYGARTSPFLDALAARSLVFRRCYAGASWTKPSVATLLTSLFPETHGVGARSYGDALPERVPTLPAILRAHGYVTALFSANALGSTASGLERGFDQAFTTAAFTAGAPAAKVRAAELHAPLLSWIATHATDRFFVFVHAVDTHPPYAPGLAEGAAYDAEITSADAALRALYERLQAMGLAERTLIVFTADHGRALGERGRTGHGLSVHEEEVRVPLLLHAPGRVAAGVVEQPVHLVDVLPTVLAACGIAAPPGIQGRPLIDGARPGPPVFVSRYVFPEAKGARAGRGPEQHAVVDLPWKLIVTEAQGASPARAQLFDLGRDAREEDDVAAREPGRVRRLTAALHAFLAGQRAARAAFLRAYGAGVAAPADLEQLRALGYAR